MKPLSQSILTFAVFLTLTAAPNVSKAAVALTYDSGEPAYAEQGNYGNLGAEFTVGSNAIEVTSVAAEVTENQYGTAGDEQGQMNTYDIGGFSTSDFTVNFYDLNASSPTYGLLGTYVVPSGTAVDSSDGFAYFSIPTLTIAAGTDLGFTEFIGDSGDSADVVTPYGVDYGQPPDYDGPSVITTIGPDLTYVGVISADGADNGGTYNPNDVPTAVSSTQVVTSNFDYSVAPEPSTYALSALGVGLLLVLARRAVRKSA